MNHVAAHVLVVDDSASMRTVICRVLYNLGFRHLDEAPDGLAALEAFARVPYDLVITDWNMPHLDGVELVRAIRRAPQRRDTPVLVLTGEVSAARVVQALDAGANGFVAKPVIMPALGEKVMRLLATVSPVSDFQCAASGGRP